MAKKATKKAVVKKVTAAKAKPAVKKAKSFDDVKNSIQEEIKKANEKRNREFEEKLSKAKYKIEIIVDVDSLGKVESHEMRTKGLDKVTVLGVLMSTINEM